MRRLVVVLTLVLASCTPLQLQQLQQAQAQMTCHQAVDLLWPAGTRSWAHSIVQRESRGIATAQNPTSSAAGCFQLIRLHAWRIPGGWANRYNATANIQGALSLYREAGTRPWAL